MIKGMHMKKTLALIATGLSAFLLLSGCSEEQDPPDNTLKNSTNAMITKKVSRAKKPKMMSTSVPHTIAFKGEKIKLLATYGIQKKYAYNWRFTGTASVNLAIKPQENYKDIQLGVNEVYSDVSVVSKYYRYNGVRQDSLNVSYSQLPKGSVAISKSDDYEIPFQVESINANETSFHIWNGYGRSDTHRISESDIRDEASGAKLNVIWTLAITDKDGNNYFKTINDAVGMPCAKPKSINGEK